MSPASKLGLTAGGSLLALLLFVIAAQTSASSAQSGAATSSPVGSKVTIMPWPKLYGLVKSSEPQACSDGRRVHIYRQRGSQQDPKLDRLIATVRAQRFRGSYEWVAREQVSGRVYAKAAATSRCRAAFSDTISSGQVGEQFSICPGEPGDLACRLPEVHIDTGSSYCRNFEKPSGDCDGWSSTSAKNWATCARYANFHWDDKPGTHRRGVGTYVSLCGYADYLTATMEGYVTDEAPRRYTITDAWARSNPDQRWCTPEPPLRGASAGEPGGPLYLKFDNGFVGADIYISGYLVDPDRFC